ncbi:MAG: FliM/FliN family flagellar motor switch protein [Phycisphaerales bacterium]|nr:MAG: FliM/FliN family flagellar motor switch protein [Phycisphaerales bacterium]
MSTQLKSILRLEVPLIVQIASRKMSMRDVANLAPGAIIELPKQAEEELELLVSNRSIGTGRAVKVGENFGLRVSRIGDIEERINAMGGQDDPETVTAGGDETDDAGALVDQILEGQQTATGDPTAGTDTSGENRENEAA